LLPGGDSNIPNAAFVGRSHDSADPLSKTQRLKQLCNGGNRVGGDISPPYDPKKITASLFPHHLLK